MSLRVVVVLVAITLVVAFILAKHFTDGPMGPIQGGKLRSGDLVINPKVDWSFMDDGRTVELQLVSTEQSRLTGTIVHNGQLFIPCDLGFVWRRMNGSTKWILNTIYLLKRWHHTALADGRVVLRVDGKRYQRQAVRVSDPVLLAELRTITERQVESYFGHLPKHPADPDAIWYFRLDPLDNVVAGIQGS